MQTVTGYTVSGGEGTGRSQWEIGNALGNLTVQNGTLDLETSTGYGSYYVGFMFNAGNTSFANNSGLTVGPNVLLQTGGTANTLGTNTTTTPVITVNGIWDLNGGTAANQTVYSLAGSGQVNAAMLAADTTSHTLTLNGTAGSTEFSGSLNDGAGSGKLLLSKTGGSTELLSGANTYSGGTTISAGVLQAGSPTALGAGLVTLNGGELDLNATALTANGISGTNVSSLVGNSAGSPATLTLGGSGTSVYGGSINDGGVGNAISLVNNSGVEELTGTNSYSGTTTIAGGTLGLGTTGAATNSPITVDDGAALGVVVTASGTTLTPASLTVGNSAGGAITAYLGSFGNPTAPLLAPGSLTVNGPITFNVSSVTPLSPGQTFTLLKHPSAPFISTALGILQGGAIGHLVTNVPNSSIDLVVDAVAQTLWVGNHGPNWDIGVTVNWTNTVLGSTTYNDGYPVTFNDTAVSSVVNVATNVQPGSIILNNSTLNYSFGGTGSLAGVTALTKNGTASLTVTTTNTFSGGAVINGGTVYLGTNGATGDLGIGAISNNAALVVNRSDTPTISQIISGTGSLSLIGSGNVTLAATNTYAGGTWIGGGFAIGSSSTNAVDGTILGGATGSGSVVISNGATMGQGGNSITWEAPSLTLLGDVTLDGNVRQAVKFETLNLAGGTRTLHLDPTGGTILQNIPAHTALEGGGRSRWEMADLTGVFPTSPTATNTFLVVSNGTLALDSTSLSGTTNAGFMIQYPSSFAGNAGLTVGTNVFLQTALADALGSTTNDTATLTVNGLWSLDGTYTAALFATVTNNLYTNYASGNQIIYSLAGSGYVTESVDASGVWDPRTITINGTAGSTEFSGVLANGPLGGTLSLIKTGGSTQILAGANTYTGPTILSGGTLLVNGSLAAGSVVTINGGTLGGTGTVAGATTVNAGGVLSPGVNRLGTLTVVGGLTLNAASTNRFVVTAGGVSNSVAVIGGTLSPNGSVIQITSGTPLAVGTYSNLFTYVTVGGAFAATPVFDVAPAGAASIVDDGLGHINLVVSAGPSASTNAYLSSLAVNGNLVPGFATNVFAYSLTNYLSGSAVGTATVLVTNADLTATNTLTYNGTAEGVLPSGTTSGTYTLTQGVANVVRVLVTSAAGGQYTNLYTVNVTLKPSQATPHLTNSLAGNTLTLTWPSDHLGYRLLMQTNNLAGGVSRNAADWGTVAGSTTVTTTDISVTKTNLDEYYRLIYP